MLAWVFLMVSQLLWGCYNLYQCLQQCWIQISRSGGPPIIQTIRWGKVGGLEKIFFSPLGLSLV